MSSNFPIALIGQAAFGESVLNALLDAGETVVAVFCPPDQEGRPIDPLKEAAISRDVAVHQFSRLRDREAIDAFAAVNAHLGVMAFVTDIVPAEMIDAPVRGTINFHPSLLPRHRGPSSMNWPIIQGETVTGLSIFWPDAGLDTGPILMQKKVAIAPDDTLGTLYFGKIFQLGVDAIVESVDLVRHGNAPRTEQDESAATYESWCKAKDLQVDWSKPLGEIYNLVRGGDPSPGSGTTFRGDAIKFFKTSKVDGAASPQNAGAVSAVSDEGFSVAADGGCLQVVRVQPAGSKKLDAGEWASEVGLKVGDTFGS